MKNLDAFPDFVYPVVNVQWCVQEPANSSLPFDCRTHVRVLLQKVDVLEKVHGKSLGGLGDDGPLTN